LLGATAVTDLVLLTKVFSLFFDFAVFLKGMMFLGQREEYF
jgi:hypothetical protein